MKDFEDLTVFTQDMDGYMSAAGQGEYGEWVYIDVANEVLDELRELQEKYTELKAMYDGLNK